MKISEIAQRIQTLASKGVQEDGASLSIRYIYNKMLTVRALLISQEIKKKQSVSTWNYQTMPCVEIVRIAKHEYPFINVPADTILRSKHRLPKPLVGYTEHIIKSIMTIDGSEKIDLVTLNAANFQASNKYTSKKLIAFLHDGYIFVLASKKITAISFIALFEDPIAAASFKGLCDNNPPLVSYQDFEFPIDISMVDALIELTVRELSGDSRNKQQYEAGPVRDPQARSTAAYE